ncbi:MAG: AMP-binding protein, partial [Bdellovibrionales bacterium]|nr:AMP-binding protein [Bdellovibrionales bacterium]
SFHSNWKETGFLALASSGVTSLGETKVVLLSTSAFLVSAEAVNQHLISNQKDIWLHLLPDFHVGGLGIWARSALSGARVVKPLNWIWSAKSCRDLLLESKATLMSLVPTQVFDLVQKRMRAPQSLRAVLVGGGSLASSLYEEARSLDWPLLPSYGLTECCSQVATAALDSLNSFSMPNSWSLLPHIRASKNNESVLSLCSDSLLKGYFHVSGEDWTWLDPKVQGWYATQDLVDLNDTQLKFLGRKDDQIKILGELVSLGFLEKRLLEISRSMGFGQDLALTALPHPRRTWELIIVFSQKEFGLHQIERLRETFNQGLLPFEQVERVQGLPLLERSSLGKVLRHQLTKRLDQILLKPKGNV